jgi:hypothetical protein
MNSHVRQILRAAVIVSAAALLPATAAAAETTRKFDFGPSWSRLATGYTRDGGVAYSATTGFGWDRSLMTQARSVSPDPRVDTFVRVGNWTTAKWRLDIPNGDYLVTLVCGDPVVTSTDIHRVVVEGKVAVNNITTTGGKFVTVTAFPATVADGHLDVTIGGAGGSTLTRICYLDVAPKPVPPPPPTITNRLVLADFEDGKVSGAFNFFVNNTYNKGVYTWGVDPTQGANGTSKSLKFDVKYGAPYFYYDQNRIGLGRYTAQGKTVNRLSYWLKVPQGWSSANPYYNMHLGWYLSNDPYQNETNNGHYYTYLYLIPDSEWMRVVVTDNYTWQRSQSTKSFDPGRTSHLVNFTSFFGKLTRFYITGAPNPGDYEFVPGGSYSMWFDELELYQDEDLLTTTPRAFKSAPGASNTVTLQSFAAVPTTYDIKVSNLDGLGATVIDESGAAVTSVTIPARGTRQLRMSPKGLGRSNVVFFPRGAVQNAKVQNRSVFCYYRGSYDLPGAAVLVVGQ